MTSGLSDPHLKAVGMAMISVGLIIGAVGSILSQFDELYSVTSPSSGAVLMVSTIAAVVAGALLAFRGNFAEGMIILLVAPMLPAMLFTVGIDLLLVAALTVLLLLAAFICFREDEKPTAVFAIIYVVMLIVMLISSEGWVDFLTTNPIIVGIISLVLAFLDIYIVAKLMLES